MVRVVSLTRQTEIAVVKNSRTPMRNGGQKGVGNKAKMSDHVASSINTGEGLSAKSVNAVFI